MRFYRAFASSAPDELSLDAALSTSTSGERVFNISPCYVGPIDEGERIPQALARIRNTNPRSNCTAHVSPEIQSAGDANFPRGRRYYWKAQFLREILSDPGNRRAP